MLSDETEPQKKWVFRIHALLVSLLIFSCSAVCSGQELQSPSSAHTVAPDPEVQVLPSDANHRTGIWFAARDARETLAERGLSGNMTLTNDWSALLPRAGAGDSVERYLLDAQLIFRSDKLFGWHGGQACVSLHHYFGDNGSELVGDEQGFSNMDDAPRTMLYELWFQQTLHDGRWRVKFGKMDANTEFAHVESAGNFLNSSMGYSPTILALPSYPEPQPGANIILAPGKYTFALGMYRASNGSAMTLAEAGRDWSFRELPGHAALGYWHLGAPVTDFDQDLRSGTQGYYAVLEQSLWRGSAARDADHQLSTFLQFGRANGDVSSFTHHVGGGLALRAPFATRPRDESGAGLTWARFSRAPQLRFAYGSEWALETYYRLALLDWAALVIDAQFLRHPGGLRGCPDTVVVTPRMVVSF